MQVDNLTFNVLFKEKLLLLREMVVEFLRKHLVCLNDVMERWVRSLSLHIRSYLGGVCKEKIHPYTVAFSELQTAPVCRTFASAYQ
jgi:hypothetical protein